MPRMAHARLSTTSMQDNRPAAGHQYLITNSCFTRTLGVAAPHLLVRVAPPPRHQPQLQTGHPLLHLWQLLQGPQLHPWHPLQQQQQQWWWKLVMPTKSLELVCSDKADSHGCMHSACMMSCCARRCLRHRRSSAQLILHREQVHGALV